MSTTFRRCAARIVFMIPFAAFFYSPSVALAGPILGSTLSTFAVLGGGGVTGTVPINTIIGNLGACCTTDTVTGYPAAFSLTGTEYAGSVDPEFSAQADLGIAITALNGLAPGTPESALGGLTLGPGVYTSGSTMDLTGTLTLDGHGNANALWVFLMTSALNTASSSNVILQNTGAGAGVYWVLGSGAVLGSNSTILGNILAHSSIQVGTNVTDLCGRLATQIESVTLAGSDTVSIGTPGSIGCSGILAGSNGLGGGGTLVNGVVVPAVSTIPEPSTVVLLGIGIACLAARRAQSARGRQRESASKA